ncbi:MAG: transcriptional regulator [Candidatus Margulisiibacteriota bacterium]|nr:MAG: hypothetical protein A2X43_08825 [Candidatus Margulisbacteria bacterium GWD2_39_127]OGI05031.1 MAG: hypothetical protein A2X42_09880 [Candidatus Margulisbacteria bacterium GWF2_38_17]OGI08073.1 MAG: hypothetical protein A2X41_04360 [Candidatus Margulisbacteria bacterium GWE2_39_32]PZM79736.1 MAG: transcriptional regulator [Candidatus Margulisiibacteriota bacterium]HAR63266.1 transcriptional regulator [Candidatus Margulisiibacteriota bacterium]
MAIRKRHIKVAEMIKSLGHPDRIKILEDIASKSEGVNVSAIQRSLKIGQSAVSQHLLKLRNCKIIEAKRQGVEIYYSIKDPQIKKVIQFILNF